MVEPRAMSGVLELPMGCRVIEEYLEEEDSSLTSMP